MNVTSVGGLCQQALAAFARGDAEELRQPDRYKDVAFRIVVKPPKFFTTLTEKHLSTRHHCFAIGEAAFLVQLIGLSARDCLVAVGWTDKEIDTEFASGMEVRLLAWECLGAHPATWKNIFESILPDTAAAAGTTTLAVGSEWADDPSKRSWVAKKVVECFDDPDFRADVEKCTTYPSEEKLGAEDFLKDATPVRARQLLDNLLYLKPLFRGDGFTWDRDGNRGVPETLVETPFMGSTSYATHVLHRPIDTPAACVVALENSDAGSSPMTQNP